MEHVRQFLGHVPVARCAARGRRVPGYDAVLLGGAHTWKSVVPHFHVFGLGADFWGTRLPPLPGNNCPGSGSLGVGTRGYMGPPGGGCGHGPVVEQGGYLGQGRAGTRAAWAISGRCCGGAAGASWSGVAQDMAQEGWGPARGGCGGVLCTMDENQWQRGGQVDEGEDRCTQVGAGRRTGMGHGGARQWGYGGNACYAHACQRINWRSQQALEGRPAHVPQGLQHLPG